MHFYRHGQKASREGRLTGVDSKPISAEQMEIVMCAFLWRECSRLSGDALVVPIKVNHAETKGGFH